MTTERNSSGSLSLEAATRELALIDRIIGLEAEVARLSIEGGIKDANQRVATELSCTMVMEWEHDERVRKQ